MSEKIIFVKRGMYRIGQVICESIIYAGESSKEQHAILQEKLNKIKKKN